MEEDRQRKIIHVDMGAFYASVEQRDNPELRGKPVAVGGSRERGVVAAASYEARKFGVRSAMPSVTAKRQCPDVIFVKPRFETYKAVSQQIREIFAEHTAIIEPLSLDEAYLDVTENLQQIPLARDVALAIRTRIKEVTGLNASAGISYNKFLAKLASDHRKPNGQYTITPEMGPAFVEALPVGKFHGIGPATSARIRPASTCASRRWSSCRRTSARPARITTGFREPSTTERSAQTGSVSLSARRTRSRAT
jgi:DNA polymerase-4